MINIKTA